MIAKSIHNTIPERFIEFNECGFDGANHFSGFCLKNNKAAHEIAQRKVCNKGNAPAVFAQAADKFTLGVECIVK